jgi:hypothetical protein
MEGFELLCHKRGGKNKDSGLNPEIKFRLSETLTCLNFIA